MPPGINTASSHNHTSSSATPERPPKALLLKGACGHCGITAERGQAFRACAGCKAVVYCSKECQRAKWADHRDRCKLIQRLVNEEPVSPMSQACVDERDRALDALSAWPPSLNTRDCAVMFTDFLELHRANIKLSIELMRYQLLWRQQDLDGSKHVLVFTVGYRPNCGSNPATRLIVRRIELVERDENGRHAYQRKESEMRLEDKEHKEAGLNMVFRGGGVHLTAWTPLEPLEPIHAPRYASYPLDWVGHLRFSTAIGLSYESRNGRPTGMWVLRRVGKKWRRVKIDDNEYAVMLARKELVMGPEPEVLMGPLRDALKLQVRFENVHIVG